MSNLKVQEKLDKMKKLRKALFVFSIIAAVGSLVMLIMFNFAPVFNLTVEGTDKFGNGVDYPGWQAIYYGIGIQYIPGYYEFGFNIWTCLGMYIPILSLIICTVMYRKGKNKRKAVLEYVMAAALTFGGITLVNCTRLAVLTASSEGLNNFKDTYLLPAVEAGTFRLLAFPKALCAVCLTAAAIKIINGSFLLYQKAYARKIPVITKMPQQ